MARGRKPETAALQAAKGDPGKRRKGTAKRRPVDPIQIGQARAPKWLKKSAKAIEVWNALAPHLGQLNLISELDAVPFARYCRYVVEWIAADIAVQKEGTWYDATGTNGEKLKKRHPAWQACQDLEKMLRETEAAFGMRPDARFKILRDQAAAHGVLPLFGGGDGRDRSEGEQGQAEGETKTPTETDPLGLLGAFNSEPPTTARN
ncbi:MAG TPA: phage terminase small subunit P27 family [Rhizobiaceae bacterium]|nr:phage terminase small subunit P27 family [Rhizobiaceae bacterium]